ncbi:MAG TPA: energy transducer TonB [Burkholderiales bacterium]|nr:energy transducer TonB [Burkholderiales bacterium]
MPDIPINALQPRGGFTASLAAAPPPSTGDILPITLAVSLVLHAILLLITFAPPKLNPASFAPQLDVVLVNSRGANRPVKADALAQVHLDGGGNTEADRRAKTNLPKVPDMESAQQVQLSASRVRQLEQEAQRLLQLAQNSSNNAAATHPTQAQQPPDKVEDPALQQQRLMIAQLEAQIAKEWSEYQKMPRRKFIGARTEGVVYAEYVDKWRQRVEKVGTRYFPEEARRDRIYGSLVVTVHIKADGSVEKIDIDRSSGHRVLDAAARRAIDLAGPFPPLPAAVRKDWDILSISRTFHYTRSDLELVAPEQ